MTTRQVNKFNMMDAIYALCMSAVATISTIAEAGIAVTKLGCEVERVRG